MTNEELTAIYSTGNASSHEKGLRAVFEAGVAAGRPRAAVFVPEVGEPIAKAGYEVVTEATEPADVPATNVDPDIVGAADETVDSAAPASRGPRRR